jgi:hypothetical protein
MFTIYVSYILIVNVADSTYQCRVTFCVSPFLYFPFGLASKGRFGSAVSPIRIGPSCLFLLSFEPYAALHVCLPRIHPPLHAVSGVVRVGAPVYYQPWITHIHASLHLCGRFAFCADALPVGLLLGDIPYSTPPLVPLCWVLSGTPLVLHYWTGRRVTEFAPPGSRLLFYGASFAPFTLNLT